MSNQLKSFQPIALRFRTKLACEIAGIDPLRLNEAIAAKDGYKCAPVTRPGRAREYGEFDLIALFLFRFLTTLGYSQSLASTYACGVLEALTHDYHELPERFDFPLNPFPDEVVACTADEPTTFVHSENFVSYATVGFNITLLRKEIQTRMQAIAERESTVFGDE
ncbi:hypothetical protein [Arenibacterium sp. LLYu02]|uniref:hypothetical protein n=1 Tax=Arenibacterium sp. LLYu02 TaxID=3404132 RepID=UPI003B228A44